MIRVHGFAPMSPLCSPSPFCVKLETWLRMAGFTYEVRSDFNPYRAPKGKAPFVTLEDGSVVADSQHIIDILSQRPTVSLDRWLGPYQRATATAIQRLVEDHLYHTLLYARWIDRDGWRQYRSQYWSRQPFPQNLLGPWLGRRGVIRMLWSEGTSRHRPAEVYAGAEQDLDALEQLLGERPFFLGDQPATVDAVVFGQLASVHLVPIATPLQEALRRRTGLVRWVERVRDRYWP